MNALKILLGDPRHGTVGAHSSYVPINIGYIGAFLIKKVQSVKIDLKLATEPEEILELIDDWKPNIIGISNYVWNSNLSNRICEYSKKLNQNILTILGGPEFPAGTGSSKIENTTRDQTYSKCFDYLVQRPSVDYFAYCDGEVTFFEIVNKFVEKSYSTKLMKNNNVPIKGCASLSKNKDKLLVGEYIPRIGIQGSIKSEGRDIIPSPYLSGMLDKFLNGKFVPAFETARGCPFLCTFCDQGLDENKITAFSTKRLAEEMLYVGKKMSKLKTGTKTVCIFDANWGLFEKDIKLADHIAKVIDKYDWPKNIHCSTPKNKRENLIKIDDKLKNRVQIGLAMQSMNTDVLTTIKRKNLSSKEQVEHIQAIQKRGKTATTELIIPLPGETEETYFEGIKFLMDNNVMTGTYTLMMLCGAELGRDEAIKKYNMKPKFRILPKQFGEYRGKKIFEVEQVCIETNTMSHQSYLNCRNFSFILQLLSSSMFSPIYKLVQKLGISWHEIIKTTTNLIKDKNFKGKFKNLYNEFCIESSSELFDSKKEVIEFYSKPKNYESLLVGDIGENLLGKYSAKGLFIYRDVLTTIFYVIKEKMNKNYNKELISILNSSEKWLKNLYMIEEIFNDKLEFKKNNQSEIKIDFDFPSWLSQTHLPLNHFKNISKYKVNCDFKKINYLRNEIKSIYGKHKERALGRYFRQHMQRGAVVFEKQFQKII